MVSHTNGNSVFNRYTNVGRADNFSDIKKMLRLVWHHWIFFAITIPLFLGAVHLYHRYTLPVYKGSVTMLFKSNSEKMLNDVNLMEGFGLSAEVRNIENQTFIIRSQKTIKEAISRLDFGVSYFADGRFKDTELYHSAPFEIEIEEKHPQILNVPVSIKILSSGNYLVSVSAEGGILHRFDLSEDVASVESFNFEKEVAPGEWIEHSNFSFRILPRKDIVQSSVSDFYIVFHSLQQLTAQYRSRLSINTYSEGSSIVFISVTGHNPQKIIRFLNVLSEVIVENNLKRKNDMASRSLEFIRQQLKNVEDTLNETQKQLMDFRKRNRFMIPSEFAARLADNFLEKEKELKMLELKYDYFQQLKAKFSLGSIDEDYLLPAFSGDNGGIITQLVGRYMDARSELESLNHLSGAENPYYLQLKEKLNVIGKTLISSIEKQIETVKIQQNEVRKEINNLSARMNRLPELEKEYLELERAFKLNDAVYTFLLQKNSETQIAKASNVPDNEVLDQATITGIVSPNKRGNYGKAFLLSLIIPAIIIGLKEALNVKIRDRDELNAIAGDVPFLGSIVRSNADSENVITQNPYSLMAESFRSLRTTIKFIAPEEKIKVILLTSTNTGEGKTFCALNLAYAFAISGRKTALVGFDMRKPRLSEIFDNQHGIGISNYLIRQNKFEEIVYSSDSDNLWVIPTGVIPPNPAELISGARINKLFEHLRNRFEVVIVDTPPIGLVTDARLLMQYSDCCLFIVRAGVTHKEHFSLTIGDLQKDKIPHLGLILNDVDPAEKRYGYYNTGYYGNPSES